MAASEQMIRQAFKAGVDTIELGIPFSDPIADGPVIQASHFRALQKSPAPTMEMALALVKRVIADFNQKSIVFMSSVNLVIAYGIKKFFKDAAKSNLAGIIIPDLSVEDGTEIEKAARANGIALIYLVSPLCRPERLPQIVNATEGFLYVISTTGTTGARAALSQDLPEFVQKIKAIRPEIPVCIGFGISTPAHAREVWQYADGAIVGSHFVRILAEKSVDGLLEEIQAFLN